MRAIYKACAVILIVGTLLVLLHHDPNSLIMTMTPYALATAIIVREYLVRPVTMNYFHVQPDVEFGWPNAGLAAGASAAGFAFGYIMGPSMTAAMERQYGRCPVGCKCTCGADSSGDA
jgi:hypothetical protein